MLLKFILSALVSFSLFSCSLMPAIAQEEQKVPLTPVVDPYLGPIAYVGRKMGPHGSGFFLTGNAVVTAKHVAQMIIDNPHGQYVWDFKGKRHRILKIEMSYDADLAVILVDEVDSAQQTAEIACEMPHRLQTMLAVGHPGPYENVTSPVMVVGFSDLRDSDDTTSIVVAGTAEPGMSGGPVFNQEGKVVGVVSSSFPIWNGEDKPSGIPSQFTNITPMFGSELCNKKSDDAPVNDTNPLPPEETLPGGGT
jgi:S1-C subfamily serine protease